jgi:hypothetical protein
MRFRRPALVTASLAALVALVPSVRADGQTPGSLLLYPEFDHTPGRNTLLSLTNTDPDPDGSSVRVEFVYINGDPSPGLLCTEFNTTVVLTPNDTIALFTSAQNPNAQRGYVYAFAKDNFGRAITHNWLIGDEIVTDGVATFEHSFNAYSFRGIPPNGALTDVDGGGAGDGIRDLDGVEYEMAPSKIVIPRFTGQSAAYQSDLILIALTGGSGFTTRLDFLIYNDNEEVFSKNYSFKCWRKVPLTALSTLFQQTFLAGQTNDNPAEVVGFPAIETGWFEIDGGIAFSTAASVTNPAFLALLAERTSALSGAELAFEIGKQNNGDLVLEGVALDAN